MLPDRPRLVKCPKCSTFVWIYEAKKLGELVSPWSDEDKTENLWTNSVSTLDLTDKEFLKYAKSRTDGYLGGSMYEHGLATLALSELWGMTRDKEDDDVIQKALEKAVDVIIRSQNPGGGWRYQPQADGGEDTSCTMTVFHCLASARQAGIMVPQETITRVGKYLKGAQNTETGSLT